MSQPNGKRRKSTLRQEGFLTPEPGSRRNSLSSGFLIVQASAESDPNGQALARPRAWYCLPLLATIDLVYTTTTTALLLEQDLVRPAPMWLLPAWGLIRCCGILFATSTSHIRNMSWIIAALSMGTALVFLFELNMLVQDRIYLFPGHTADGTDSAKMPPALTVYLLSQLGFAVLHWVAFVMVVGVRPRTTVLSKVSYRELDADESEVEVECDERGTPRMPVRKRLWRKLRGSVWEDRFVRVDYGTIQALPEAEEITVDIDHAFDRGDEEARLSDGQEEAIDVYDAEGLSSDDDPDDIIDLPPRRCHSLSITSRPSEAMFASASPSWRSLRARPSSRIALPNADTSPN
ncbi:uncharacterized protein L969DRAFT_168228 [Mixia osmundae IAM 14324]|uniref:Uncharacterized protein n=1 Tax=Mixia osmundae (strain CBS 9802 / IAM 14324 / JCM 22182 / KY 12970) TaxID=764103 RepID=G7DT47_MIXOS|nr:uncharacterized protein L969DRAFT_168228 [Mixia osmundae IAM 14324]KEI42741.1 hypothetical protein L969DRAFT_168228 [Mixia osmundae IAM 14324]GAA93926.1 hypothetical protein E5Q_00572 [Mixia osmundae IAM 14324]